MGYRSCGKLWLSEKAKKLLPDDFKKDLDEEWEYEKDNIWAFNDWKWYTGSGDFGYPEPNRAEAFMTLLRNKDMEEDFDFARIGEDYDDTVVETYNKFHINRDIGVY